MDRTRIVFLIYAAIAITVLTGSAYSFMGRPQPFGLPEAKNPISSKKLPTPARPVGMSAAQVDVADADASSGSVSNAIVLKDGRKVEPIFAPDATLDDGLPLFVCGTVASGSYYQLQVIQMAKLDEKNKFHLGLVPYDLDSNYEMSEDEAASLMRAGKMDCLLTTLDTVALHDHGIVTAINSEGAGTDQLWVRDVKTLNDLKGKRIVTTRGDSNEYLARYLLSTVNLDPGRDVRMIYVDTLEEALHVFADGEADAISGYEPAIQEAQQAGGKLLASTRDFRAVVDVIVTAEQAVTDRAETVMQFHRAWFDALGLQAKDFTAAAKDIAAWGHNDYTGIHPATAARDFRAQLDVIAQANLAQNQQLMNNLPMLLNRMNEARRLWKQSGQPLPTATPRIDSAFVLGVAKDYVGEKLDMDQKMVNGTFSLAPQGQAGEASQPLLGAPPDRKMIAVLPCSRFEFEPDTTDLLPASQTLLDECVVRTMRESVGLLLRIRGSSAWPGPKGSVSQQDVEQVAQARAEAVASYLRGKGIPATRLRIEFVLPPPDHRETMNEAVQAKDRYVEMALMMGGQ